jgi:hypothetical protein
MAKKMVKLGSKAKKAAKAAFLNRFRKGKDKPEAEKLPQEEGEAEEGKGLMGSMMRKMKKAK